MKELNYTLTLLSDAEPGTGMGGELVNQRVPKDTSGLPIIPANHLKGLIREELLKLKGYESLASCKDLANRCLGKPDDNNSLDLIQMNEGLCRFTDATIDSSCADIKPDYITRTAMNLDTGCAENTSLRTSERIAVGTRFHGKIIFLGDGTSKQELAIRLALLALSALGSGRNRGMGKVLVTIEDEDKRTPGTLLLALNEAKDWQRPAPKTCSLDPVEKVIPLRLTFRAEEPVCLPERPVVVGPIQSGFAISASAVRGAIITRMAQEYGDDLASKLYDCDEFRAWPLLPCGFPDDKTDNQRVPVRVSLTHKIAKLVADGESLKPYKVEDKTIAEVSMDKIENNSPLKASDGVLLVDDRTCSQNGHPSVSLWKAGSMPYTMTAHGVHNGPPQIDNGSNEGGRNLYQVESISPLVWSGVVLLPENWACLLMESIKANSSVAFGRFRTTRGFGQLTIQKCDKDHSRLPWSKTEYDHILILQTPILLPDIPSGNKTANEELEELIKEEWKDIFADGNTNQRWTVKAISTNIGIRFGWNRNGRDEFNGTTNRQRACRVALPGSIFMIGPKDFIENNQRDSCKTCLSDEKRNLLHKLIQKGLGKGVKRGYGAVCVHPGMADSLFTKPDISDQPKSNLSSKAEMAQRNKAEMAKVILDFWRKYKDSMPTPSQISAVADKTAKNKNYLNEQLCRTERIWATWEKIKTEFEKILLSEKTDNELRQFGYKLLIDLVKFNASNKGGDQ